MKNIFWYILTVRNLHFEVDDHLNQLPVDELPGVGLVHTSLQKDYGMKTGEMLWYYSRGIDYRPVGSLR
ncbi:hypothetical protein HN51_039039 [Arachis hypogaea]